MSLTHSGEIDRRWVASRVINEEQIFAALLLPPVFAAESMGGLLLVLIAELIEEDFVILDRPK